MTTTPPNQPRRFHFMQLDVYIVCRELTALVVRMNLADSELRDQATRAVKSILLNLSEGLGMPAGAQRRRFMTTALGSVHELAAAVDVAAVLGLVTPEVADRADELAYRARGMLAALAR